MGHEVIVTGPYPYFSSSDIFFAECTCGKWGGGKNSEHNLRKRHIEHAEQMEKNERDAARESTEAPKGSWGSNYERGLNRAIRGFP